MFSSVCSETSTGYSNILLSSYFGYSFLEKSSFVEQPSTTYYNSACMFFPVATQSVFYTRYVLFITMFMKQQVHGMQHTPILLLLRFTLLYKYECNKVGEVGNHTKTA